MKVFLSKAIVLGLLASGAAHAQRVVRVPVAPSAHQVKLTTVALGNVPLNVAFTRDLSFTNTGSEPTLVSSLNRFGGGLAVTADNCTGQTLATGQSCNFTASVTVSALGAYSASLSVVHSSASEPDVFQFTATGTDVALSAAPSSLAFGDVSVGESSEPRMVTVTNQGPIAVDVTDVRFLEQAAQFDVDASTCLGELAPGATCAVSVTFTPLSQSSVSARLAAEGVGQSTVLSVVTGAGVRGSASFSATQLTFNDQAAGVQSPPQAVTLTNTGRGLLTIDSLAVTGDASFVLTGNTCGTTLAAGASCLVSVAVTPPDATIRTGYLRLQASNTATPVTSVQLYVSPAQVRPVLELSPSSLVFASTAVGSSSDNTVTLRSTGNSAVSVSGFTVSGADASQFTLPNVASCTGALPAGQECLLTVRFTPTSAGSKSATLTAAHDSVETVGQVLMSGGAVVGDLTASPASLTFGQVTVGASTTRTVVLANSGQANVVVNELSFSGAHGASYSTSGCSGQTLAPGQLCTVTVTFSPSVAGMAPSALTVAHSGVSSSRTVTVTGEGLPAPTGVLALDNFSCNNAPLGSPTACNATLSNTGTAAASTAAVPTRTGTEFAAPVHTCGASLAAGATCTVSMTQTFATAGVKTTVFSWVLAGATQTRNVSATVETPQATFVATAPPATQVNTPVTTQAVLRNVGSGPVSITVSPAVSGSSWTFVSTTCGSTLAQGDSCSVTARCSPSAAGTYNATFEVGTNAGLKTATAACVAQAPSVTVTNPYPGLTTDVGTSSQSGNWRRLTNSGLGDVTINALVPASDSNSTNPLVTFYADGGNPAHCVVGKVLRAGESCDLFETFTRVNPTGTPLVFNNVMSAVSSTAGAHSWTSSFAVHGVSVTNLTGTAPIQAGVASTLSIRVSNNSPFELSGIDIGSTGVTGFSGCPATLAAGASCTLTTSVTPAANASSVTFGAAVTGMFPRVINGTVNPAQALGLAGSGSFSVAVAQPAATLAVTSHGPVNLGSNSTATHTLTNTGVGAISVTATSLSGSAEFTITGTTCGSTLAAGATCTVTTTFAPVNPGPRNTTLNVTTSAGVKTGTVTGVGAVTNPVDVSSIDFGTVNVGSASPVRTVVVTNGSSVTMAVNSIVFPAAVSRPAVIAGDCLAGNFTLAPGASCNLRVVWTPSLSGTLDANLVLNSNYEFAPSVSIRTTGTAVTAVGTVEVLNTCRDWRNGISIDSVNNEVILRNDGNTAMDINGHGGRQWGAVNGGAGACLEVASKWKNHRANGIANADSWPLFVDPTGYYSLNTESVVFHAPSNSYVGMMGHRRNSGGTQGDHTTFYRHARGSTTPPVTIPGYTLAGQTQSAWYTLVPSRNNDVVYQMRGTALYRYNPGAANGFDSLGSVPSFSGGQIAVDANNSNVIWFVTNVGVLHSYNVSTGQLSGGINVVRTPSFTGGWGLSGGMSPPVVDRQGYLYTLHASRGVFRLNLATGASELWYANPNIVSMALSNDDSWLLFTETVTGGMPIKRVRIR